MTEAPREGGPPALLAGYTTLGLGGPARSFASAATDRDLVAAVRAADAAGEPVLVIGGGSNLVISDEGFGGTVVHVNTRGLGYARAGDGLVDVTVAAGEEWDGVVAATVGEGLAGVESLSGIPGRAGATPIQNVGAYGSEVAEAITRVRVYDRQQAKIKIIPNERCSFAYRTSLFKSAGPRYVVLDVTFRLARQALSLPVKYAELAAELGVPMGGRAEVSEVRSAVLKIRARKGMVLSPGDPDTRSAGSFFTNPVLTAAEFAHLEAAAAARAAGPVPGYKAGEGLVKVPAAWLIERAGFAKGYGSPGPARVSSKHTLALVNAGDATTADLLALARELVSGVRGAFGVTLAPEPILVGVTLLAGRPGKPASQSSTPASMRPRMSGGAAEPRIDIRASSASSGVVKPWLSRAISYCVSRRRPNRSGSSAPRASGTPASNRARTGTDSPSAATPSETLEEGQTSHVMPAAARRRTTRGSSTDRTPWPILLACSRSRVAVTLAGPTSSPACGTSSRPARAAIRNARSKSAAGPRRSSLESPKPTTPWPEN